jgi:hypothetical protein
MNTHARRNAPYPQQRAWIAFDEIRAISNQNALAICRRLFPGGKVFGTEYVVRNPKRNDHGPGSFKINLRSGRWADFATHDRGGDMIALVAWRYDVSQLEAARRLTLLLAGPGVRR